MDLVRTVFINGQLTFLLPSLRRWGLALIILLGGAFLTACKKPATDAALDATPPGRKDRPTAARVAPSAPGPVSPANPPAHHPSDPEPAQSSEDQARAAADLAAEYTRPDTDDSRRVEVISELAINGHPASRQTLIRIYRSARSVEEKQDVIAALQLIESEDLEPSLLLLQEAVAAGQDADLRTTAIDALRDIPSPKTIRIWQTLLADRDEEIRNTAKVMIEFLAGENQP